MATSFERYGRGHYTAQTGYPLPIGTPGLEKLLVRLHAETFGIDEVHGSFTAVVWQSVVRTIAGQAEPQGLPVTRLRCLCPQNSDRLWLLASDAGGHCSLFFFYLRTLPPRNDHVRIVGTWVGLASPLCDMWSPLSDLQRFLVFSNGAAVSQCACLTTPRPVGPPCELAANLVRLGGAMTSSNPPSMAVTLAHACRPLVIDFYTRRPPPHKHGRTVGPCVGMPSLSFHHSDRRGSLGRRL